jgi:predicted Zn-dependent protease
MIMEMQNTLQAAIELFRQGMRYQALEQITQLLATSPNTGKAWELKGLIEDSLSWQNTSIHSLETATTLIPISASGQYVLAKNYLETGKIDLAISVFAILLQREDLPDQLLPVLSSYLGRRPETAHLALQACRKAIRRDPDQADSWLGMAHFMNQLKYPQRQVASVLRKAVSLDPENHHYRLALSRVLEQMGEPAEAYRVVKQISRSNLQQIDCTGCLEKLLAIFQDAHDQVRQEICRKKLSQLQASPDLERGSFANNRLPRPPRQIRN